MGFGNDWVSETSWGERGIHTRARLRSRKVQSNASPRPHDLYGLRAHRFGPIVAYPTVDFPVDCRGGRAFSNRLKLGKQCGTLNHVPIPYVDADRRLLRIRNGLLVSLKHCFGSLVIADGHGFSRIGGKMIEFSNFRHGCHLRRLSIVVDDGFPDRQATSF